MSFIKTLKRIGPQWESCGTPDLTEIASDKYPLTFIIRKPPFRYEDNHFSTGPEIAAAFSFRSSKL